jgi:hypothetical protein
MRFFLGMKKQKRRSKVKLLSAMFCLGIASQCLAGDLPIERDFLRLPDHRWIWLEKIDWHKTRVILGKGKKSFKNRIWSKDYETDGKHHTWAYAFFVRIRPARFFDLDKKGNFRVAVSTTDLGNNVIRYAIIYRVMSDRLEIDQEIPGFNAAADGPVFEALRGARKTLTRVRIPPSPP